MHRRSIGPTKERSNTAKSSVEGHPQVHSTAFDGEHPSRSGRGGSCTAAEREWSLRRGRVPRDGGTGAGAGEQRLSGEHPARGYREQPTKRREHTTKRAGSGAKLLRTGEEAAVF